MKQKNTLPKIDTITIYVLERDNPDTRPEPEVSTDGAALLAKVEAEWRETLTDIEYKPDDPYVETYWNFEELDPDDHCGDALIDRRTYSDRYEWRITKHELPANTYVNTDKLSMNKVLSLSDSHMEKSMQSMSKDYLMALTAEECGELLQAFSKIRRLEMKGVPVPTRRLNSLCEELAHVTESIQLIAYVYGITPDDINSQIAKSVARYPDGPAAMHQKERGIIHEKPLSKDELKRIADEDNYIEVMITIHISDVIDNDLEGFLDILSKRVTNSPCLTDINYTVTDIHQKDTLVVKVTGDISDIID